jgi:hypothetical protein
MTTPEKSNEEIAEELALKYQSIIFGKDWELEKDIKTALDSLKASKDAEISSLKLIIECAKTPLMANVMNERDRYRTLLSEAVVVLTKFMRWHDSGSTISLEITIREVRELLTKLRAVERV